MRRPQAPRSRLRNGPGISDMGSFIVGGVAEARICRTYSGRPREDQREQFAWTLARRGRPLGNRHWESLPSDASADKHCSNVPERRGHYALMCARTVVTICERFRSSNYKI